MDQRHVSPPRIDELLQVGVRLMLAAALGPTRRLAAATEAQ
jgi:hypothetical protein